MRSLVQNSLVKKTAGLMLSIILSLVAFQSIASEYQSRANGNWNDYASWSKKNTSGNFVNAISGEYPIAGDIVTIYNGNAITLTGDAACTTLTLTPKGNASSYTSLTCTIYKLDVSGSITVNANSSSKTATLSQTSGTITVGGDLNLQGDGSILNTGTGTLNIGGNLSLITLSTFTIGTSEVNFNSTSAQSIPALTYNKLTITGSSKSLAGNTTVNGILDLTRGSLSINENNLTLGASGSISRGLTTNYIKLGTSGSLTINNIGATAKLFPIGTVDSYTPATISNSGTAQSFTVNVAKGVSSFTEHVVDRTWNVSAGGATGTANATLTLQWNSATDLTTGFNSNASMINHFVNGAWETKGNTPTAATLVSTGVYSQTRSGITSFSPFAVGDNVSPLPVELVSFQAVKKDAAVVLNWETATEKNNKGFEIQASANGKTFETFAFVASQNGTANYSQRYAYTDKVSGKEGMMYYRLKQVDLDGTITFSSVKAVDLGRTSTVVTAFPNPFQNQFELSLQTSANQNATVIVTDLAGKIVYNATQTLQKGSNNLKVSLTNQPAGIYLIKATAGNQTYTNRLVKQ